MTLTTHTATGMFVAYLTNDPILGFFAAMGSHYITDAIPHGDEFIYWRHVHKQRDAIALAYAGIDLFFVVFIIMVVLNFSTLSAPAVLALGAAGGILPDLLMTLNTLIKKRLNTSARGLSRIEQLAYLPIRAHYHFHQFLHDLVRYPVRFRVGLFIQILLLIAFILYMVR
ncbi:MAG: hypothetical protein ABIG66_00960 [Candidatus Kerfeldbacteria bacterium]